MATRFYSLFIEAAPVPPHGYRSEAIAGHNEQGPAVAPIGAVIAWLEGQREAAETNRLLFEAAGYSGLKLSARLPIPDDRGLEGLIRDVPMSEGIDGIIARVRKCYRQ